MAAHWFRASTEFNALSILLKNPESPKFDKFMRVVDEIISWLWSRTKEENTRAAALKTLGTLIFLCTEFMLTLVPRKIDLLSFL